MTVPVFANHAIEYFEAGLAVIPCGKGEERKEPSVFFPKRRPGQATLEKWSDKWPNANIGILPNLSGLTIVDVDDTDYFRNAIQRFGDTPIIVHTPGRDARHLWYQNNGERSRNLRNKGLPIDIKAGENSLAIGPHSRHPNGGEYHFLTGSFWELSDLPKIKDGALRFEPTRAPKETSSKPRAEMIDGDGRNSMTFDFLRSVGKRASSWNKLLSEAHSYNQGFGEPMNEAEIVKTAKSVWDMRLEGRLVAPGDGPYARVPTRHKQELADHKAAYILYDHLLTSHIGRRKEFVIAPEKLAKILSCAPNTVRDAVRYMSAREYLVRTHVGGKGKNDPHEYQFGPNSWPGKLGTNNW